MPVGMRSPCVGLSVTELSFGEGVFEPGSIERMFTLRVDTDLPGKHWNLTGFAALGQFFARDYKGIGVR